MSLVCEYNNIKILILRLAYSSFLSFDVRSLHAAKVTNSLTYEAVLISATELRPKIDFVTFDDDDYSFIQDKFCGTGSWLFNAWELGEISY